jgi:hypothetical protein
MLRHSKLLSVTYSEEEPTEESNSGKAVGGAALGGTPEFGSDNGDGSPPGWSCKCWLYSDFKLEISEIKGPGTWGRLTLTGNAEHTKTVQCKREYGPYSTSMGANFVKGKLTIEWLRGQVCGKCLSYPEIECEGQSQTLCKKEWDLGGFVTDTFRKSFKGLWELRSSNLDSSVVRAKIKGICEDIMDTMSGPPSFSGNLCDSRMQCSDAWCICGLTEVKDALPGTTKPRGFGDPACQKGAPGGPA